VDDNQRNDTQKTTDLDRKSDMNKKIKSSVSSQSIPSKAKSKSSAPSQSNLKKDREDRYMHYFKSLNEPLPPPFLRAIPLARDFWTRATFLLTSHEDVVTDTRAQRDLKRGEVQPSIMKRVLPLPMARSAVTQLPTMLAGAMLRKDSDSQKYRVKHDEALLGALVHGSPNVVVMEPELERKGRSEDNRPKRHRWGCCCSAGRNSDERPNGRSEDNRPTRHRWRSRCSVERGSAEKPTPLSTERRRPHLHSVQKPQHKTTPELSEDGGFLFLHVIFHVPT
jgi:hypothetical protein